jgi:OPT oligopeptide transporter protein
VLAGALPWGLVGTGASFALSAMLAGLPGLAFAVGIYLPLASLTPIFVGGLVRRVVDARRADATPETDPGVLASSGMIAGEGLAGVAIAFAVAARTRWPDSGWSLALGRLHFAERGFTYLSGLPAAVLGLIVLGLLAWLLFRAGRRAAA